MNTTSLYLSGYYIQPIQPTQTKDYQWPIVAGIIPNPYYKLESDRCKNHIAVSHFMNYVCYFLILVAALIAPFEPDKSLGIAFGSFISGLYFSWVERRYTKKLNDIF